MDMWKHTYFQIYIKVLENSQQNTIYNLVKLDSREQLIFLLIRWHRTYKKDADMWEEMEQIEFCLLDLKPSNKNIIYHCDGQKLMRPSIYMS